MRNTLQKIFQIFLTERLYQINMFVNDNLIFFVLFFMESVGKKSAPPQFVAGHNTTL